MEQEVVLQFETHCYSFLKIKKNTVSHCIGPSLFRKDIKLLLIEELKTY